jgi:hypothetical protein
MMGGCDTGSGLVGAIATDLAVVQSETPPYSTLMVAGHHIIGNNVQGSLVR